MAFGGTAIPRLSGDRQNLPASFAQKKLWFLDRLKDGNAFYNVPTAIRLCGPLDIASLTRSLQTVIERHEVLQTNYAAGADGLPYIVVRPHGPLTIPVMDVSHLAEEEKNAVSQQWMRTEASLPFKLETDQLIRAHLLKLKPEEHILVVTMHHIVSDGWSRILLLEEMGHWYKTITGRQSPSLPEFPVQYADYAGWQNMVLEGESIDAEVAYWKERLEGAPIALDLPFEYGSDLAHNNTAVSRLHFVLPVRLRNELTMLARREGVTMFMLLLAAFQVLLARYTGQDDLVVGTPISGRTHPATEKLIGFFVNAVAIRADLTCEPTFLAFLKQVKAAVLGAFAHQTVPFEKLVEFLQPQRLPNRNPLFQVIFMLENASTLSASLGRLHLEAVDVDRENVSSPYEITLYMGEEADSFTGAMEYRTALFSERMICQMVRHLGNLLEAIAAEPARRVSEIGLFDAADQDRFMEMSQGRTDEETEKSLAELFQERAALTPESVALLYQGEQWTYHDLDRRSNQLVRYLQSLDIGPEAIVGVAVEHSPELIVTLLGVLKSGAAYLPLDVSYPAERLRYMVKDAGVKFVITNGTRGKESRLNDVHIVDLSDLAITSQSDASLRRNIPVHGDNLAYVIYTSGSTGVPKGVMNTHRAAVNRLAWMWKQCPFSSEEICCQKTSLGFVDAAWEIWGPLLAGIRLVIVPEDVRRDTGSLIELLEREQVTRIVMVPSLLKSVLEYPDCERRLRYLKTWIVSGEELPVSLLHMFHQKLTGRMLLNLYGSSEVSADVTCSDTTENPEHVGRAGIGRPIANTSVYVLDRWMKRAPVGVVGEIYASGAGLSRGYLRSPAATAERFVPNPFDGNASRLYRTGDWGRYRPTGELEYWGRRDQQVKIRGHRIDLTEIAGALEQHEAIKQALVLTCTNASGETQIGACIVPTARQVALTATDCYQLPNGLRLRHHHKSETDFQFKEIFEDETYTEAGIEIKNGDCIFDIGANIGMFTTWLRLAHPGARIYAFEPNPAMFALLSSNAEIYNGNTHLFPYGISKANGTLQFAYYSRASVLSGFYPHRDADEEIFRTAADNDETGLPREIIDDLTAGRFESRVLELPVKTLSESIRETGVSCIDLLKIDVERSELDVLLGIEPDDWKKIRQIVAEVENTDGRLQHFVGLLRDHGFEVEMRRPERLAGTALYNVYARAGDLGRTACAHVLRLPASVEPADLSPSALIGFLSKHLPDYMLPSHWIVCNDLPYLPNGKADRIKIVAMLSAVPQETGAADLPQTPLESTLAGIFEEVLNRRVCGRSASFFEMGGHSLLAAKVIARIQRQFSITMTLRDFFNFPSISALAEKIEESMLADASETRIAELLRTVEGFDQNRAD
ncbi:MAG: amino acid adenylation domain-containing protein [Actinomycetota bacterium]